MEEKRVPLISIPGGDFSFCTFFLPYTLARFVFSCAKPCVRHTGQCMCGCYIIGYPSSLKTSKVINTCCPRGLQMRAGLSGLSGQEPWPISSGRWIMELTPKHEPASPAAVGVQMRGPLAAAAAAMVSSSASS